MISPTQYLVVGIDVAKDRHHAFVGTATGKTLLRGLVFDNTREGFDKLLFQAETLMARQGLEKLVFGMEPTADYYKPLGECLITHGHIVVFVGGSAVKKNSEILDSRWDKYNTEEYRMSPSPSRTAIE